MDSKRLKVEHALYGLGLFGIARRLYRLTPSGRGASRERVLRRDFFTKLINPGDLIFDVGANLGNYAELFAGIGARVVALEPNPDCVSHIRRSYPKMKIDTVNTAVGACPGVATIRIAQRSDISSMSADWMHAIAKAQSIDDSVWSSNLTVPVITLDSLIQRYGKPRFIKIDVEGFEENVLAGLSEPTELLSFEFNTNFLDATSRCLELLGRLGDWKFNYVVGEPHNFELSDWVNAEQLSKRLEVLDKSLGYGDVFAMEKHSKVS